MFEPFQKFLPRATNKYGVSKEVQAASVCHEFAVRIPKFFENKPEAEKNLSSAYYKNKTLFVRAKSPAWAQEVIMRKEKIIDELNTAAGKKIIQDLKTIL